MYKLTSKEVKEYDNFWNFINIFKNPDFILSDDWYNYKVNNRKELFSVFDYRKYIILKIREKYTITKFYFYEKILNKLLYNLI